MTVDACSPPLSLRKTVAVAAAVAVVVVVAVVAVAVAVAAFGQKMLDHFHDEINLHLYLFCQLAVGKDYQEQLFHQRQTPSSGQTLALWL